MTGPSSFRAYIDEAGDEGFNFLPNEKGSTRWFVLSALVVRRANDLHTLRIIDAARTVLEKDRKYVLHFRHLRHEHRIAYVRCFEGAPFRFVSVFFHKPSTPDPEHFQQQKDSLYRYLTRLLLERVSWLVRDHRRPAEGDGYCDLVFSNRSAMSYSDLCSYLGLLKKRSGNDNVRIDWSTIDPERVKAVQHDQLAGLQLVDAVASGCYQAVNRNPYGNCEDGYLRLLAPLAYRHQRSAWGYGVKIIAPTGDDRCVAVKAVFS